MARTPPWRWAPCGVRPLISSATVPWPIEKTWKPPESVTIGPSQPMKSCRPPKRAMQLVAGVEEQVERVAEHHVVAERRDLGGQQALDRRLRRQRDEGRRAHLAVGGAQDAGAGPRAGVAGGDRQGGHRGHGRSGE